MDLALIQILSFLESKDKKLTEIDLASRGIGDEGVVVLVDAIGRSGNNFNTCITTLDLRSNDIGRAGAEALASFILSHPSMTKIQLMTNDIGPEGAIALSNSLRDIRCRLKCLQLKLCGIGKRGAEAIASALEENCTLEDLHLEQNNIGDDGARAFGRALSRNSGLCKLELGGNFIGPSGVRAIAEGLKTNHSLEALGINENRFGDEGAEAIANALRSNTSLNWLFLSVRKRSAYSADRIGTAGVESICRALYNDSSAESVFSSNHTLKEIYGIPSDIQERLRRLLRYNKLGPYKARREKITLFLSENPTYIQSSGVDLRLVPRILYKAGREYHGSILYNHIRENPDILPKGCNESEAVKAAPITSRSRRLWRGSRDEPSGRKQDASLAELDAALLKHR